MTATIELPPQHPTAPREPSRDAVTEHEVGHSVVAMHIGLQVQSISVNSLSCPHRTVHGRTDVALGLLPNREAAQVLLAGPIAQWRAGYDNVAGCREDYGRVLELGYHPSDRDLAGEVMHILDLHEDVVAELAYTLDAHGTLSGSSLDGTYDVDGPRRRVQAAALASEVWPDDSARDYARGLHITEQLVRSLADGEQLLGVLRTMWTRTPGDWLGQRWLVDTAASIKDRMGELPVREARARRHTKTVGAG